MTQFTEIYPGVGAAPFHFEETEQYLNLIRLLRSPRVVFYEWEADQGKLLLDCANAIEKLLTERKIDIVLG